MIVLYDNVANSSKSDCFKTMLQSTVCPFLAALPKQFGRVQCEGSDRTDAGGGHDQCPCLPVQLAWQEPEDGAREASPGKGY